MPLKWKQTRAKKKESWENEIGINGKFYYPKDDLTATSILIDDVKNLPLTHEPERTIAMGMRAEGITTQQIQAKTGELITLHFDLRIWK